MTPARSAEAGSRGAEPSFMWFERGSCCILFNSGPAAAPTLICLTSARHSPTHTPQKYPARLPSALKCTGVGVTYAHRHTQVACCESAAKSIVMKYILNSIHMFSLRSRSTWEPRGCSAIHKSDKTANCFYSSVDNSTFQNR